MARVIIGLFSLLLIAATPTPLPRHPYQTKKLKAATEQAHDAPSPISSASYQPSSKPTPATSSNYTYNYYYPPSKPESPSVSFQMRTTIVLIFFNFALWVNSFWQSREIQKQVTIGKKALLLQFRPKLIVRHVGLLTEPDRMLVADEQGTFQPIVAVLIVANDGGAQAEIIDGNITLRVLGGSHGFQGSLERKPLLPQFDRHSGLPVYGEEPVILAQRIIKRGDRQIIRQTMPLSDTIAGSVRAYLATHSKRNIENSALVAFGYFEYRDQIGSSYRTAFCRRYDRGQGRFIIVDEPDYEYAD